MISSIGVALGRVFFSIGQWGIIAATGHFLGLDSVGRIGVALAIVTPLSMLSGLSLRAGIATDIAESFATQNYRTLRLKASIFLVAASTAISFSFFQDQTLAFTIIAVSIAKAAEGASELTYGIAQRKRRYGHITRSYVLRTIVAISIFIVTIYLTQSLPLGAFSWAICWILIYTLHDRSIRNVDEQHYKKRPVHRGLFANSSPGNEWKLALTQLPLAAGAALGNAGLAAPRVILENQSGLAAAGVFTALFFAYQAGNTVIQTIGQLQAVGVAAAWHSRSTKNILKKAARIFAIIVVLSFCGMLFAQHYGSEFLTIIYGEEFSIYGKLFTWMGIAWVFRYLSTTGKTILTASRNFKYGLKIESIAFVISLMIYLVTITENGGIEESVVSFIFAQTAYFTLVSLATIYLVVKNLHLQYPKP